MPTYVYPPMPLTMSVWFRSNSVPPPASIPDTITPCSCSPCRPEDFFRGTRGQTALLASHIIRTAPDGRFTDNNIPDGAGTLFPATVLEIPDGSEHWYYCIWAHQVGAGFDNWHARIYACRFPDPAFPAAPYFEGWI